MSQAHALIIDDNPTNILVLQQLLSMENVASEAISKSGNIVAELDSMSNIDVVFLDLEMPTLDGYEVVRVIKAHPNFKSTRVIAYSVHVSELHNAFYLGFDGFLGKPLNAEAFPEQLGRILNGETVSYLP